MEVLGARRSVSMPAPIPYRTRNMALSNPIEETMAETSILLQGHQRMIREPYSISETHNQKPIWFFLLSRTGQTAAMRKINALYKQIPGLAWEEKWVVTGAALRENRSEEMAGIDEAILHMRRFIVFDGDSPPPNLFANCSTEQERLDALLARPSPSARLALDMFSRRTASDRSMTSSSDTQEAVVDVRNLSEANGEDMGKLSGPATDSQIEYQESDKEDDENTSDEEEVMQRLIECCNVGYGTF